MNAEYYSLLNEFLSFKTVHNNGEYKQEFKNCSSWLESLFLQHSFNVKNIIKYGAPILVASYDVSLDAENVVIYGSYDVSPANKNDGWKENPFSLYLGKDNIIGRGVAEGKGQLLLQMMSVFKLISEDNLKYNVTFLIEGERLIGSNGLKTFLQESLFLQESGLSASFLLSSIGTLIGDKPVINTSFRGNFDVKLDIKSANKDVSTDVFSGIVVNPAVEGAKLVSKLYDVNNQVNIPYFYYEVENISANEKTINGRIPFDKEHILQEYEMNYLKLDDNMDFYSKIGRKPAIEVTSFSSGESLIFNNSIPNSAKLNISVKLVPNQKTSVIKGLFEEWIKSNIPNYLEYQLNYSGFADAIKINLNAVFLDSVVKKLNSSYGKNTLQIGSGFSFPIAKFVQEKITKNILNIPMVNDNCNLNSCSENFSVELIEKGTEFLYEFFKK